MTPAMAPPIAIDPMQPKAFRLDGHTTITMSLALAMLAGVYQYGRQSQRVDDMTHKIEALTDKVGALTVSVAQLVARIDTERRGGG